VYVNQALSPVLVCPAETSVLDAAAEAYHNPVAVWWRAFESSSVMSPGQVPCTSSTPFGVVGQDRRQGVLDDRGVIPAPAAGDQEAEGLAHDGLPGSAEGGLTR
jgi:hypothetical protein